MQADPRSRGPLPDPAAPSPPGHEDAVADEGWQPDVLGPDYQAATLALPDDDEGPVVATLVRHQRSGEPPRRAARAVLYVHGWNDYFFQTGLAEFWAARGVAFHALDLRKYGRSLGPHQTPGYTDSLDVYDAEIAAALARIRDEHGERVRILLMGHSTGGLVLALWLDRNPGSAQGLVLNSPWLELQGSAALRHLSAPVVEQLARFQPRTALVNVDQGFYARAIRVRDGGEWEYDEAWRPTPTFPIRAGWLRAIITGHARVARGLHVAAPVFVAASARTIIAPRWSEDMRRADTVLDVELIARRAVQLGPNVTVVRVPDGLHDLTLSAAPARELFYRELGRWEPAYGWG